MAHSDFLDIIKSRGFFHQCSDEEGLRELTHHTQGVAAYIGFDCTAPSLHVGSLLQIMLLRWWQKCGHKPIVLMGGGTTKVGDPSGKDESRPQLSDADIAANMAGIKRVFDKFLTFGEGSSDAVMVNNDDWLKGINYIEFLRDYGRHFSVNRMMSMDSVKLRLERDQHMSFLEFNYMILQAYDFVELNRRHACRLQMGGSDQWGNIVMGVRLRNSIKDPKCHIGDDIEKEMLTDLRKDCLYGLTSPLMTTSSGAKMGKTAAGAVWLNSDKTSSYDYWQYWRNTEDADVGRFLKLFTELDIAECDRLGALEGAEINEAKKMLATEATAMLHGREAAKLAERTAVETFERGGTSADLPEVCLPHAELEAGMPAYLLLVKAGLASSNGEARRLIAGKGARVNDVLIDGDNQRIGLDDAIANGAIKLSSGKKKHLLVKPI